MCIISYPVIPIPFFFLLYILCLSFHTIFYPVLMLRLQLIEWVCTSLSRNWFSLSECDGYFLLMHLSSQYAILPYGGICLMNLIRLNLYNHPKKIKCFQVYHLRLNYMGCH